MAANNTEHLFDLAAETAALRYSLNDSKLLSRFINFGFLTQEHFADAFHRDVWKVLVKYFNKFQNAPNANTLAKWLMSNMTPVGTYKPKEQMELWRNNSGKLFREPKGLQKMTVSEVLNILEECRKSRIVQGTLIAASEKFRSGRYTEAMAEFYQAHRKSVLTAQQIVEGNLIDDFAHHIQLIKSKKSGVIKPLRTNFLGLGDTGEKFYRFDFDKFFDGGLHTGEFVFIMGSTGTGKSYALMEFSYLVAALGINVILFTLEMSKDKLQWRTYSRMSGVDYKQFRTGNITKSEYVAWKQSLLNWKRNKAGIFHVVSFSRGASVAQLRQKHAEVQERYGAIFPFVAVDYLNEMGTEAGGNRFGKDWSLMLDISSEMQDFAKSGSDGTGLSVISAGQKRADQDKLYTDWNDAAFSKQIVDNVSLGLGITQIDGRMRWDVFKNRDGGKGLPFYTFPDFPKSMIHSPEVMNEYMAGFLDDLEDENE